MNRIRTAVVLFAALFLFAGHPALPAEEAKLPPSPAKAAPNPLIEEMLTLDGVFRDIVSAVALSDSRKVQTALAPMHGVMEKTHEGIEAGSVTLPKNAARISEFVGRDRKFHEMLEALDRAAGHNHHKEQLRITKQLLDQCVQCHRLFGK